MKPELKKLLVLNMQDPLFVHLFDLCVGVAGAVAVRLIV